MSLFISLFRKRWLCRHVANSLSVDEQISVPKKAASKICMVHRFLLSGGALLLALSLLVGLRMTALAGNAPNPILPISTKIIAAAETASRMTGSDLEMDNNPVGSDETELAGVVVFASADPQGHGIWIIRAQSGYSYSVLADGDTEFGPQLPETNQSVKVKGRWRLSLFGPYLQAYRIDLKDKDDEDDDEENHQELQGILLSVPANGIGVWVIQTGLTVTIEIVADGITLLDDGIPSVGHWLEVHGEWNVDNRFVATRIRKDSHKISEVIVRLARDVVSSTIASRYELVPQDTLLLSGNIHLFSTEEDEEKNVVAQLTSDPDVLWAELNYVGGIPEGHGYKTWRWGGTTSDGYINQGAFEQVNLAPALHTFQGEGTVIAILDTGVNQSHSAFSGRLLPGYDMVDDDATPEDEGDGLGWGHGTHITGIVARVSPQSKLLPVRVLNSNGRGNTFALAYAIEWSVEQGADVVNLSLGADADSRVLKDVIDKALEQGVIIVAAAGNMNSSEPLFPASVPGVLSVTAVDGGNAKADFASYGTDWVHLAAPGVGITSTIVGPHGSGYASWSGTSMATGFVSGAAALARQRMPAASVAEIQQLLTAHTRDLDNYNPTYVGQLGGLLDVAAALDMDNDEEIPIPQDPTAVQEMQLFLPLVQR